MESFNNLISMIFVKLPEGMTLFLSFAIGRSRNENQMVLGLAHELDGVTEVEKVLAPVFVVDI